MSATPHGEAEVCAVCHKRPAELIVTEVTKDGKSEQLRLCQQCAREKGLAVPEAAGELVAEIVKQATSRIQDADRHLVCGQCGTSYADFKRTLRLGCPACYTAFAERLLPMIRRMHGTTRHTGRSATNSGDAIRDYELRRLRHELKRAIEAEDYERAARVRDLIRQASGETPAVNKNSSHKTG